MSGLGFTWLAPWALGVAALGALGVLAAHLLARHRPPRAALPTARFVPAARPASATRLSPPSDVLLLLLRALAVLLAGAAFAQPVRLPARGSVARVVAVDRSRAAASLPEVRAAAGPLLRSGDRLVVFDSAAEPPRAGDEARRALDALAPSPARGSLSAGLAAAMRAGAALGDAADSVELVLVSPLARGEADAATLAMREQWPGRVRVVPVRAGERPRTPARVAVRAPADDPLAAALALAGLAAAADGDARVRLVRDRLSAADSAWASADTARVLVHWPADPAASGWAARARTDSAFAVAAGDDVVVAPFARTARPPDGRVVARWADGEPAATERRMGAGCVRSVAVPVPAAGDLALRAPMRALARTLAGPCAEPGAAGDGVAASGDSLAARLAGAGPLASSRRLVGAAPSAAASTLAPWLLGAAIVLLLVEMLARRARPREEAA